VVVSVNTSAKLDAWLWLLSPHCNATKAAKVAKATEASRGFPGTVHLHGGPSKSFVKVIKP
jgi:hypothetical protein